MLMLLMMEAAYAQPTAGPAVDPTFIGVANAIEQSMKALPANQGIRDIGWQLFGFFALAQTVYILVKHLMTGKGLMGAIEDGVPVIIASAVVVAFLDTSARGLTNSILSTMEQVTATVMGGSYGPLAGLMVSAAGKVMQAIRNLWDLSPTSQVYTSSIGAVVEALVEMPMTILAILAKLVSVFLMMLMLGIYIAHLVMSQIGIYIAMMLAPFFVPFLIFPPASFLFDGWLRFFLGAAMLKIVGLILIELSDSIMGGILKLSTSIALAPEVSTVDKVVVDIVQYAAIILLSGILALMMAQAPSIATGLISGNGGGASFSGWSSISSRSMATRALTGGMGEGGGGGAGKPGSNVLSGLTRAMPNVVKPATNGLGSILSKGGGSMLAKHEAGRAKQATNGERVIQRDTSRMDARSAGAYQRTLERKNAQTAQRESAPTFYGPPSPRYVLSKPDSSTTPRNQKKT